MHIMPVFAGKIITMIIYSYKFHFSYYLFRKSCGTICRIGILFIYAQFDHALCLH
jgi:hypothetical protein